MPRGGVGGIITGMAKQIDPRVVVILGVGAVFLAAIAALAWVSAVGERSDLLVAGVVLLGFDVGYLCYVYFTGKWKVSK